MNTPTQIPSHTFGIHIHVPLRSDKHGTAHLPGSKFEPESWPDGFTQDSFTLHCRQNLHRLLELTAGTTRLRGTLGQQLEAELERVVGHADHRLRVSIDRQGKYVVRVECPGSPQLDSVALITDIHKVLQSLRTYPTGSGEASAWEAV